jgi:hypothetical protein
MIEISDEKYRIECTFYEALLYVQFLEIDGKNGWRLPTQDEYLNIHSIGSYCWYSSDIDDPELFKDHLFWCIPVRDI